MARWSIRRHATRSLHTLALLVAATSLVGCTTRAPLPVSPGAANPAYRYECDAPCPATPDVEGHMLGKDLIGVLRHAKTPYAVSQIWFRVSDEPFGTVLAQVPWPGEPMRRTGGLTIVVSGGPTKGTATIDSCEMNTRSSCDQNVPSPTTIHIEARGFRIPGERVRVPDVAGLARADAARMLSNAIFSYRVVALGGTDDRVLSQRPRAGTLAHAGVEIVIRVGCNAISVEVPDTAYLYDPCSGAMHQIGMS